MRFVDVRNLLGKAFCDYLLTGEDKFKESFLKLEVPGEFLSYKEERVSYYLRFIKTHKGKIPASTSEGVIRLTKLLNGDGLHFEAHEVVEKFWLTYKGNDRLLLQAIIQVAIANIHLESGNLRGYRRMKELALKNLKSFGGTLHGVDVDRLKETLKREGEFFIRF